MTLRPNKKPWTGWGLWLVLLLWTGFALFLIGGCTTAQRIPPVVKLELTPPDSALASPCRQPTAIPQRELTQGEVEALWSKDRVALSVCYKKHRGIIRYFETRDQKLAGS